jgi:hypothetical protein
MKNIVRAAVLALAVIGFASQHALTAQAKVTNTTPIVNRAGSPPAPTCNPDQQCGWGTWGKGTR